MQSKKWDTLQVALYGAPIGAAIAAIQGLGRTRDIPANTVSYAAVGEAVGGAIGGILLFAAVSGIRNLLVR